MEQETARIYRILNQVTKICIAHGLKHVVLSPGSRSAPVALSFIRNPEIKHFVINDERSAGYMALGMAQSTCKPTILVCTSGTAVLNYFPAIAEAYFQRIPLLILTADRPPELIDQNENQTIFQKEVFGKHVLRSFETEIHEASETSENDFYEIINEAISIANGLRPGPVHINIPLREPLYLSEPLVFDSKETQYSPDNKTSLEIPENELAEIKEILRNSKKIMILPGLNHPNTELNRSLVSFAGKVNCLIPRDITSNIPAFKNSVFTAEENIKDLTEDHSPDLLISFGGQIVSKNMKNFLRRSKIKEHWHIDPCNKRTDTFGHLTKMIHTTPEKFFRILSDLNEDFNLDQPNGYLELWQASEAHVDTGKGKEILSEIIHHLPEDTVLHLGNSSIIRNAQGLNCVDFLSKKRIPVYCNRGTSGIDGTLSTAAGFAMVDSRMVVCILGDLSFIYDSNALWNRYLPPNFKIIVLNNHGGGIFKQMEGPSKQPELEEYFVTPHGVDIGSIASAFGVKYEYCDHVTGLKKILPEYFSSDNKCRVLETSTPA